jgi:hypothetical protein
MGGGSAYRHLVPIFVVLVIFVVFVVLVLIMACITRRFLFRIALGIIVHFFIIGHLGKWYGYKGEW